MQIIETTYKWAGTLARRSATRRIILHYAAAVTCTPQQVHQWHLANGWSFMNRDIDDKKGTDKVEDAVFFYPIIGSIRDNLIENLK